MQNVPKIVSERLKVATPAVNHPDADVLAAFSEQSLLEFERAIVVEHLARCRECRDIVALALPVADSVPSPVRPSPSGWLAWPTLRWGFVAAGIVAIASIGVLRHQRLAQPSMTAYKAAPSLADTEAKNQSLATPSAAEAARERDEANRPATHDQLVTLPKTTDGTPRSDRPEPQALHALQGGVGSGSGMGRTTLSHGPKAPMQWQQLNANANAYQAAQASAPTTPPSPAKQQATGAMAANVAIPPASQMVAVQSQSPAVDVRSQTEVGVSGQNENVLIVENQPLAQLPSAAGSSETRIEKTKPADNSGGAAAKMLANSLPSEHEGRVIGGALAAPRWAINSTGGLQRSFDQGNTWQDVNVNGSPGFNPAAAASVEITAAAPSRVKAKAVAKEEKADKADQKDVAPFTFRAVAANGVDVWAGGSSGLLYHSADAGTHWTRVVPSSSGATLTGDIFSLQFSDAQHGKVSTSTAETWTTDDGGHSWQKQ
jgi:hypothetical protein